MGSNRSTGGRGYAFGPFMVDCLRRTLARDGQPVPLTSKALDVLILLIEQRERTVSKEDILESVWGDRIVEENNLFRQISRIRKALDERPGEHLYLVTISGEGYRFVGQVSEIPHPAAEGSADETTQAYVDQERDVPTTTPQPMRHRKGLGSPRAKWVIGTAGLAGTLFLAFLVNAREPAASSAPILKQVTFETGFPREAAWSPDGRSIAFTSDRAGSPDIWTRNMADQDPVQITTSSSADSMPAWSPDGQWLAFRSSRDGGGLYVAPSRGGTERRIADFGEEPRWSPDGSLVLFTSANVGVGYPRMYVVGLDGAPPRLVRPDLVDEFRVRAAAWHPDGRVSMLGSDDAGPVLLTSPLEGGTPVRSLTSEAFRQQTHELDLTLSAFVWSPAGNQLFFEGVANRIQNLWRVTVDPATLLVLAGPDRLTVGAGADANLALSPSGTRIAFSIQSAQTRLWSYPFDPAAGRILAGATPLTSGIPGEVDAAAAGDGSKFAYRTVRGGRSEVWERSIEAGKDRLLFTGSGSIFTNPRWSPDGRRLAFSRRWTPGTGQPSQAEVVLLTSADKRVRVVPVVDQIRFSPSDWSGDGQAILGSCQPQQDRSIGLCLMAASENSAVAGDATVLASDPERELWNGRISPDRRWIVFQALDRSGRATSSLFVIPAAGGAWTRISDSDAFDDKPHWSPDGGAIYFVSRKNGLSNVWGRRFDSAAGLPTGPAFRVTAFESPVNMLSTNTQEMDISVTQKSLLVPITQYTGQLWVLENADR